MSAPADTDTAARTGRYGLLFVGILLIAANLRAGITAVGPVLGDIRDDLALSGTSASILVSIPLVAFAVFSSVAPALAARLGMERSLGAALLALAAAIVVRSLPAIPAVWVGTVFLGVAVAVLNVTLPALVKRDYPDQVGRITGIYSSVQSAAAAVASGAAVPLAGVSQNGWRLSLGVWAGLAIIAFAVFLPQLRHRSLPRKTVPLTASSSRRPPWRSAIAWYVTVLMGLQSTVYYTLITWLPSVERSHGATSGEAGWHQFAYQMLSIVGNLTTAAVIHRWRDQRWIAATATGLVFSGIGGQLLAPGLALLWVIVAGTGTGSAIVLALSLFGLRTRHHEQAAALSGMAQTIGYLLAAVGPVLIGLLHDATSGWTWPLVTIVTLLVVQAAVGVQAGRDRYLDAPQASRPVGA